jgi:hypothetical protein
MFDYQQRAGTKEFRANYDKTFRGSSNKCPHCDSFVSKNDRYCWSCKESLGGSRG